MREITVIGGGAGSFNLLSGLRAQTDFALRSIVTMMDSGGDSGALRDAFGVLPPGDLRRCLVALSEKSQILRDLFSFRFEEYLMTKAGETDDWGARRHVDELAQRAGRAPDAVLVHEGDFARARLRDYAREGATPVADDLGANGEAPFHVLRADLASAGALIHHDPDATGRALAEFVHGHARVRRSA